MKATLPDQIQQRSTDKNTTIRLAGAFRALFRSFAEDKKMDIVDTAAGAGNFKTLVAAVKAADLTETLKGLGPFTVFVPT